VKFFALPFDRSISVSSFPDSFWCMETFSCCHKRRVSILCFFYWWSYSLLLGLFIETSLWILWDIYSFSSSYQNSTFYCYQMF
jgi:hypothetical protein